MGPRVADTGVITTVHLAIIAVLAVVTIIGILWGIRLKRSRDAAQAAEIDRVEDAGGAPTDPRAPIDEPAAVPAPAPEAARVVAAPPAPPAPTPLASPPPVEELAAPAPLDDEPIAAAAPLDASPATVADPTPVVEHEPEPAAPSGPPPQDGPVTLLKGLGPKVAARLADLGVMTVGDLAALDAAQAETIDARLGPFTGRMARDRWIEQARFLAAGDVKGFEAVFGRL